MMLRDYFNDGKKSAWNLLFSTDLKTVAMFLITKLFKPVVFSV